MNPTAMMEMYELYRKETIKALDTVTEDMADRIPGGFGNSLRWNFGHILVAQEQAMFQLGLGEPGYLSEDMMNTFKRGSSSKDWAAPPCRLDELKQLLEEQMLRMRETFTGRLEEPLARKFNMGTDRQMSLGEMFVGTLWHEGVHQGIIDSLKRTIQFNN